MIIGEGLDLDVVSNYAKLIFYCISMNLKLYSVKSEPEVNRKYSDLLLVPMDKSKNYKSIMIEFKYLKKDESSKIKQKQKEAKEQLEEYCNFEDIRQINDLNKYTVVAINDELYVEKI